MKGIINKNMVPPGSTDPADEADDEGGPDESDPNFQQGLKFAMAALYQNGAAKQIAETVRRAQDVPSGLADATFNIISITDEKTEGRIPDELLVLFAGTILEEIVDIATAAGVQVKPSDLGEAMKAMILRYLGENGYDTNELQSAMDKFDTGTFDQDAMEQAPDGGQPQGQPSQAQPQPQPQEGQQL